MNIKLIENSVSKLKHNVTQNSYGLILPGDNNYAA